PFRVDCENGCGNCAYSSGQAVSLVVGAGILDSSPYTFAHELGHFFLAPHAWSSITAHVDPQTHQNFLRSHLWDMEYKPGTCPGTDEHKFFKSRAEAAGYEASLIEIDNENCTLLGDGTLTCTFGTLQQCNQPPGTIYKETHATGSDAMKGLGFQFAAGKGPNVMTYYYPDTTSSALSDSQIEVIRKHIRWARPLSPNLQTNVWPGGQHTTR